MTDERKPTATELSNAVEVLARDRGVTVGATVDLAEVRPGWTLSRRVLVTGLMLAGAELPRKASDVVVRMKNVETRRNTRLRLDRFIKQAADARKGGTR